jgi:hypothetical protein
MRSISAIWGAIAFVFFCVLTAIGLLCWIGFFGWAPLDPMPIGVTIGVLSAIALFAIVVLTPYTRDLIATTLLCAYNALFDDSPARTHRVKVRRFERFKNKRYRVYVDSWRPGHVEEELYTNKALKDRAPEYVDVVTHAGALGIEYVTSVTIPR